MRTDSKYLTRTLAVCLMAVAIRLSAYALTPTESTSVLYLKQEEKVARDVYQALAVRWDHPMFRNIAASEQRHLDATDRLIARFGLTDTTPAEAGRFSIPELQNLHDDLVAQGSLSLVEALRVGVLIEEADIADLKEALGVVSEPMIQRVFDNLLRASGHHLNAFQAALGGVNENGGVTAASTTSPRPGVCAAPSSGRGRGNGAGNGRHGQWNGARGSATTGPRNGLCAGVPCPRDGSGAQLRRGQR
jgi:hypothetical protein